MKRNFVKGICYTLTLVMIIGAMFGAFAAVFADNANSMGAGDTAKVKTNLNVRAEASAKAQIITVAKKGEIVTVVAKSGEWYNVKLQNGKVGFVYGKYIELLKKAVKADAPKPAAPQPVVQVEPTMVLATTTSTQDTGLLDYLVPIFEKKYNTKVKVVAVGTGEAIEMGKQGNADVLLVHARKQEDAFVESGYGTFRKDVMYNYFFLVGPKDDPAKIAGSKDVKAAFMKIAETKSAFISRGDKSGTNTKELSIWTAADIKPQGAEWYKESGQGMGDTLMMANEMGAYTLVDSGTWYAFVDKLNNMKLTVEGDSLLFNPYGVIPVNPAKYPNIHNKAAMAFANFITSDEGQALIGNYKKNGQKLFVPNATK